MVFVLKPLVIVNGFAEVTNAILHYVDANALAILDNYQYKS